MFLGKFGLFFVPFEETQTSGVVPAVVKHGGEDDSEVFVFPEPVLPVGFGGAAVPEVLADWFAGFDCGVAHFFFGGGET